MPVSAKDLDAWHRRPGALQRLIPPWHAAEVISQLGQGLSPGSEVTLRLSTWPLRLKWRSRHHPAPTGEHFGFVDEQIHGPFPHWRHIHRMLEASSSSSIMEDRVEYTLPAGVLGHWIIGRRIHCQLEQLFAWRHARLRQDLLLHQRWENIQPLRIVLAGSSGLIGQQLSALLTSGGHQVRHLVRGPATKKEEISWKPDSGELNAAELENLDAVIHLGGAGIADKRWNEARKRLLWQSRVNSTSLLAHILKTLQNPPKVFLCASAIGIYSPDSDESFTENSPAANHFLAKLCQAWEEAAQPATSCTRVVHLRLGIVLSALGGTLKKILPVFRAGLGGPLGNGRQWFSWIHLDDVLAACLFVLHQSNIHGAVNLTAPNPVRNNEFTRIMGQILHRPAFLPAPAIAISLLLGEMGRTLLLRGSRVMPDVLNTHGFSFAAPALRHALMLETGSTLPQSPFEENPIKIPTATD